MPGTTGMKPGGFYDENSTPQMAAIEAVLPWLEESVAAMDLARSAGPVVVADFGCSEGRNSIAAARPIIAALRARTARPIQTVHSDLATNNFNQLFANLYPGGRSVFADAGVFPAAVAGSMYDQLLPSQTVAVATTYNAIGFLDQRPTIPMPDYILPMGPRKERPGVGVSPEARQACAAQARADLVRFYHARAEELVPGGKLLIAVFGATEELRACDGVYDVLNDALLDLVSDGRLARGLYERLVFPIYFRTTTELVEPLASAGLADLFQLERVESMEAPVPFNLRFERTADASAHAREFASFMRAFTEPIIRMTFSERADIESLLVDLYAQVEARLARDPSGYAFRFIQVAALLTRR